MLKLAWNSEVKIQQQVAVQQFLTVQLGSFKLEKKNSLVVDCSVAFGCSLGNRLGIAKKIQYSTAGCFSAVSGCSVTSFELGREE
jgi:hypothetical protein